MSNNTDGLSVNDFGKICRTCLGEGQMKCLYEKCCKDNCLIEMLLSVTFLQLSEKDGLPFQICLKCEEEITKAYKFATKCLEVDKKLRSCMKEFQSKIPNYSHNKTTETTETLQIIEIQDIDTENVEMRLKTEIEIKENGNSSNIKPEWFRNVNEQNNSEKHDILDGKSTQSEDENNQINNERISEIFLENNVNDKKVSSKNEHTANEKHDTIDNKWIQNEDANVFQDESYETEDGRIDENLPKNNNSDEKINSENGVSKAGKQTKRIRKTKTKQLQVDQIFQCKKCYEKFPTSKLLWVHHKAVQHPPDTRIICEICSESVGWQRMAGHMRVHTKEKPFCCKICSKQFSLSGNLSRHMRIHTGEKSHKCQYCDKCFNQSSSLKTHVRIHTGERPYICENCGKGFRSSGLLKFHLLSHEDRTTKQKNRTSDEPNLLLHECDVCHRKYKTNGLLKAHMILHGEKKFLCSECGRRFLNKTALDIHSTIHTGIKRYSCDTCGKKFRYSPSLKQHTLIHTGEKPHVCKICNRGFTQAQHLKHHLRTHTGEKPYSCTFCGKSFALNVNLRVHTRTHTGETPYLCPICGKGYYDSSSMKKHKQGHEKYKT